MSDTTKAVAFGDRYNWRGKYCVWTFVLCHSVIALGGKFTWNWSKVAVNRVLLNAARAVWSPVFFTHHRPHHVSGVRGPENGSLFFRRIAYVIYSGSCPIPLRRSPKATSMIFSGSSARSIESLLVPATSAGTGWVGYVYWFGWHRHLFFQDLVKEHESLLSVSGLEGLPLQVLQELGDTGPCLMRRCTPSSGLALDTLQRFSVLLRGWVPDDAGIFQAGPYNCNVGKALAILGTTSEIHAYESELLVGLGDYVANVGGPGHLLKE